MSVGIHTHNITRLLKIIIWFAFEVSLRNEIMLFLDVAPCGSGGT